MLFSLDIALFLSTDGRYARACVRESTSKPDFLSACTDVLRASLAMGSKDNLSCVVVAFDRDAASADDVYYNEADGKKSARA
jgi:hypothetical protein